MACDAMVSCMGTKIPNKQKPH